MITMEDLAKDPAYLPAITTWLTRMEIAVHLSHAWKKMLETAIKPEQLAIVWSQVCLETAAGKSMMNNNFGNIKKKPGNFWTSYKCHEYDNQGVKHEYLPPHPQTYFSAWKSPDEGAMGYLVFLQNKYPKAFQAIQAADLTAYVHALKAKGYFTAPEDKYLERMKQEQYIFDKEIAPKLTPEEEEPLTVKEPSIERRDSVPAPVQPSIPPPPPTRAQEFTLPEIGSQGKLSWWQQILMFFQKLFR